ncbi:hypothetical protein MHY85_02320 [Cellulomonas sp. ACRRI]|uniref:hypothetical protein n=1 Tax=Cellulomonas sp. ACRRI TaxID=2918188 RepID=UPI001EF24885|nr:hypothetical protein [Cellulomonas sp. ACRRI]MCG7284806.1 hypothetical protein [Cellulomonas sp. ACRRI]
MVSNKKKQSMGDRMNASVSNPLGNQDERISPYVNGIASLVLAATAAVAIALTVLSSDSSGAIWWILILGVGQALVFWLAVSLPMSYRIAASVALLCAFMAAYVPGLLQATPLGAGPAVVLAVVGSIPMWCVAAVRLVNAKRDIANT